ncbi:hypothetical protein F4811DRAFT_555595 [Daldinia bambusicola]|nr:hypothetical protein F4811DRAFT_555595 [Daldinia bambusicola]
MCKLIWTTTWCAHGAHPIGHGQRKALLCDEVREKQTCAGRCRQQIRMTDEDVPTRWVRVCAACLGTSGELHPPVYSHTRPRPRPRPRKKGSLSSTPGRT